MTELTITTTCRNWMTLRQAHLAACEALLEDGNRLGAAVGGMLGIGFTKAMQLATPPVDNLVFPDDEETLVTAVIDSDLFGSLFLSLDTGRKALDYTDDGIPVPTDTRAVYEKAWLAFKAEAILAEVG